MSINHAELSEIGTPQMYLIQMDSSYNIRANDLQVLPLHILNTSLDFSPNQLYQLKQKEETEQNECLLDICQEPTVSEKDYQENQQQCLSPTALQCVSPKQLSVEICETELIPPSLITTSNQVHKIEKNEQVIRNYVQILDRNVLPRAIAVLPNILQLRRKDIICPRRTIPPRTRLGPVQGITNKISTTKLNELVSTSMSNKTPLFVLRDSNGYITHIDVSDKDKSNWISLLPLGDENTANLWIYQENNELYVITTVAIPSRKQLMLGYSKQYAEENGLLCPCKDILAETPLKQSWWCYVCQRTLPSQSLLQKHIDADHEDDMPATKRAYRCRHCTRTFCRLFTLRRHMARYCDKKLTKSNNVNNTETLPEPTLNSTLNTDDNRIPSDESFQNYSNSLDFTTNLFDTDRMPSLDISGTSRSEIFPYGLDSESLTNDLGYANGCSNKTDISPSVNDNNKKKSQPKNIKPPSQECPYCNRNVVKGKKRQHVSECPARRFECECKKVFTNKELFAHHVYTVHNQEPEGQKRNDDNITSNATNDNIISVADTESQNIASYSCEQCQHSFKRRGMLVNHLWRVHGAAGARVPLARRLRHYPCGTCPKLYRSAAKRDRHRDLHHPGAERVNAEPMEGGIRLCAPATCSACPRQYATRAKLLQHQRYHHPHLVPSPRKTKEVESVNETNQINASGELLLCI